MEMKDEEMTNYFDQSISDYKQGSNRIKKKLPKMIQGYFDFTEACFEEGAISKKHKQLTALSISIHARDEYCIIFHTKGAVEQGATEQELMESIAISAALGGGQLFHKV
ncbi:carboxymuconolactone decarboxylase family protein [Virgibacillus sp. 179-BFC.A HS]|uniref:Carboxymuconolactone decarboxylase family protein n=1 Tax=Tigheibacillus jepli TaxID=3035914 RepID=A0ABU5CKW2_9BACI|nr:carboxymuconolactone decarboxylase family protein [Virgibacillus sp. 179-BFC.A HS]MDY0406556.1 carboxymuconolactone decarboxylase family protein [Virgibacillus sp. 179-BFC.A HS]